MTAGQISELLKSPYAIGWLLIPVLLLAIFLLGGGRRRYSRAWAPLQRVVRGKLKHERNASKLIGTYQDQPLMATIARGGKDLPDTFTIEMPGHKGGRDWEVAHRSEKMLGPEGWRLFTKDPALQARMEAAGIPACMRDWPEHVVVRYDSARGMLSLTEQIFAPPEAHFRAQLGLLQAFDEVNGQVNRA
jgi:hypothetical protein